MSDTPNIVQTALQAGRELSDKVITNPLPNGRPILITRGPKGEGVPVFLNHEHTFTQPARTARTAKIEDMPSFLAYWVAYSNESSRIYASTEPNNERLVAVINDHTATQPNYADHRAVYAIKKSPELQTWQAHDRTKFESTEDFASFIEENLPDFVNPDGARMLEIASNLTINANAAYGKAVRLSDGNIQLSYTNEVNARSGEESLPSQFDIRIPVHAGYHARIFTFSARLRVRLNGSKLIIWYELARPEKIIQRALDEMLAWVQQETGKDAIIGTV